MKRIFKGRGSGPGLPGVRFAARPSAAGKLVSRGMTLVEVMVAMAIIAVVAVMCVSAFMTVLGAEMRETNTRLASEEVETQIATGAEPVPMAAVDLELGGYTIPSTTAAAYEATVGADDAILTENGQIDVSGKRGYTVLEGNDPPPPPGPLLCGKGVGNDPANNHYEPFATPGGEKTGGGSGYGAGGGSGYVLTNESYKPTTSITYFGGTDGWKPYVFRDADVVNVRVGETGFVKNPAEVDSTGNAGVIRITYVGAT
jgi:prepilin-type N-terminal cleavage/methylation domain-containing protein